MGSPGLILPDDFEFGANCPHCDSGGFACFLPDRTPKYVKITIYNDDVILISMIWKQQPGNPCDWGQHYIGNHWMWWEAGPIKTTLRATELIAGVPTLYFSYFDSPPCQTAVPNTWIGPVIDGTHAIVTWGPDIDEAAFLAQ